MAQRPFIAASALSLVLLALPAPWHLRANNSGTILYILWSFLGNLVYLVNTIIWSGNTRNIAPIWCDISSKLIIGFNVALSAVSLCIQRRLYRITRVSQVSLTATQKQRDIFIDFAIGLGIPVLVMILHVVVQGHRYDIIEDFGCMPTTYPSYYAYTVILPWPWVLSAVSMVYAGLTIRAFLQRRSTFNDLLKSQGAGLNVQRYIRLMALALTEVLLVFPISMIIFVHNVTTSPPKPYRSWAWVHSNFGRISYISRFILSRDKKTEVLFDLSRWCMPISAFLFFIFFGMASEARKQYRRTWYNLLRRFGFAPPEPITSTHDNKDTPLSPTSTRLRPSFLSKHKRTTTSSSTAPLRSPPIDKKRPDTFAWLDESLDKLDEEEGGLPRQPSLAYLPDTHRARDIGTGYGHTPCTPSTSSTSAFHGYGGRYSEDGDEEGTVGRHASISTAHTGKMRAGKSLSYDYDADDATICGVPTSLKRPDSMNSDTKVQPGIPFEEFTQFRRERRSGGAVSMDQSEGGGERESRISIPAEHHEHDARSSFHIDWFQFPEDQRRSGAAMEDQVQIVASPRNSVASSNLEHEDDGLPRIEDHELGGAQVQIFVSSPTNSSFDRSARASRDGLSSVHSSMHDLVSSSSASASVSDEDYRDIHRQSFPRSIMTFDERLTPQMESVPLPTTSATNSPSPLSMEVVPSPVETIPSMIVPSPVVESPVTIPSPVTSIETPTPTTTTMNSPVTAPQTPLSMQMPPPRPLQIQRLLPSRAESPRPHAGAGMLAPPSRGGSPKPRTLGGDTRPSSVMSTATDGGETVFYTPPAGRLSLGPADFEEPEYTPTAANMKKETTD